MNPNNRYSPNLPFIFLLFAILTQGLGNKIFTFTLFTDISTIFIYLLFISLIILNKISIPNHLLYVLILIFFHSFILNIYSNNFLIDSFIHFIGLLIYTLSIFSFLSIYKNNPNKVLTFIYKFSFYIAIIGVFQFLLYVILGISFIPNSFLSDLNFNNQFTPDVLAIFPRVTGLSYEPSHYAIILLPGSYIALLNLSNVYKSEFKVSKKKSIIIILGLLFSFSFVGFIGLFIIIFSISRVYFKYSFKKKVIIYSFLMILFFAYSQTSLINKLDSTVNQAGMISEIDTYKYTSSDNTAFSLISNLIVAGNSLKKSYLMGTGINTHKNTYDETIYNNFNFGQFEIELNKKDAGSLIIRLFSEFGVFGFFIFIFILLSYKIKNSDSRNIFVLMNNLSLVMILSFSLRNGGYLTIFLNVFCALYYYSYKEFINKFNFNHQ